MNFSPGNARRKWPFGGSGLRRTAMVTAAAADGAVSAADPATAARRPAAWPLAPWGDLFGRALEAAPGRARIVDTFACAASGRRTCDLAESLSWPSRRPRRRDTLRPASGKRTCDRVRTAAVAKQTPQSRKPAAPAAAAPPPSACRLALSEEIAIAPSIPDIHGPGGCGGEDLVRLEAVVLPDKQRVALTPAATLRCTMASAIADWVRTDMAPLAAGLGGDQRSRQFRLVRMPRPQPRGGRPTVRTRPRQRARRSRRQARRWPLDLAHRPRRCRANCARPCCIRCARGSSTVLGPGSDGYHEDHIHLDLMERRNNYRICQWNVWEPLPQIAPLLPAARPEEAPPREVAAEDGLQPRPKRTRPDRPDKARHAAKPPMPTKTPQAAGRAEGRRAAGNKKAPVRPALSNWS